MRTEQTRSAGEGLERSCARSWLCPSRPGPGVELLRAWFAGEAYRKHRHDTYAIGVTDRGVQMFDYRGAARVSTPGQVVVLHPDEMHDGRAGTDAGFGYRIVYLDPSLVADVMRALGRRAYPLPFVSEPVSTSPTLVRALELAFEGPLEPIGLDTLVVQLVDGIVAGAASDVTPHGRVDVAAVARARELIDAECARVVHSRELEDVTGLNRYALCRQFRVMYGTTPHRYLMLRRLDLARQAMHEGHALAEAACDAGFADQAHFTRAFTAAFGLTPARYRTLHVEPTPAPASRRGDHRRRSARRDTAGGVAGAVPRHGKIRRPRDDDDTREGRCDDAQRS